MAQFDEGLEMEDQVEEEQEQQKKEIKPLLKLWYLEGHGAFVDSTRLDTLLDYYHVYNPIYKDALTVSYIGNYGTPYQNNNFFKRESSFDFFFLKTRDAYLLAPEEVKYYNTRTPYTLLDFSQSEHRTRKNETRFNVLHTRNINPYWNVTLRYDQAKSAGQYRNQESKNNFFTLYSSYNRNKINVHSGLISNSIKNNESGGLTDDSSILNNTDTDFLDVHLSDSRSEFGNTTAFATGEYRIGKTLILEEDSNYFRPIAGVIYSVEYQTNKKEFINEEDTTNTFFQHHYYGNDFTKDSIRFRKIQNIIQLKQYENPESKTSFGKRVFLGQEFVKASMPGPPEQEFYNPQTKRYSNIYAGGGIFRNEGRFWTWNFDGKIYLLGRNLGQTELSGVISKPFTLLKDTATTLSIEGSLQNIMPDYFQETYYSQHFIWDQDLKMEQRMTVKGSFKSPERKLEIGANYALINNFIYNDTAGIPSQTNKELLVLAAHVDKDFNLRNFHFRTRLLWQKASNEEFIHLPDLSAYVSINYKFVLAKVLYAQLGIDTRYTTAYYADAYNPATGLFHLQKDVKVGDFPYIDAYANLKLKRTRVFFKMINVGTEFINKPYFTVPHYPMNRRTFRFGVAWWFYD
ncbi:MAG: putative porin [Prolixibacteraceae bacterium]